jgi:hypothetical protein
VQAVYVPADGPNWSGSRNSFLLIWMPPRYWAVKLRIWVFILQLIIGFHLKFWLP